MCYKESNSASWGSFCFYNWTNVMERINNWNSVKISRTKELRYMVDYR